MGFERAGYLMLSGGRKSVKIVLDDKTYYVGLSDVQKCLKCPGFAAQIVKAKGGA